MPDVRAITPHIRQLEAPAELRGLQGWILWRYEQFPGEAKPRKVPYYSTGQKRHGRQGAPQDRAKLVTFDAAKEAAARRGFDGVGLALMPEWGVTALDFDDCVGPSGDLPPEVQAIVSDTYAEFSPSGHGIRAFVKGDLGNHKDLKNPAFPWNMESFASSGYVTFTGNALPSTELFGLEDTIAAAGPAVLDLCARRFGPGRGSSLPASDDPLDVYEPPLGLSLGEIEAFLSDLDPSMGRDEWIRVGMALHHETEGHGFDLWDEWSASGVQYPGTEALEAQWLSFDRETGRRPVTMGSVKVMSAEARRMRDLEPRTSMALDKAIAEAREAEVAPPGLQPVRTPEDYEGKFHIVGAGAFAQRPAPKWWIKGVVPVADMGVLFGPTGSGKSFVVLDLVMAVARGVRWRDRRVRQGRVLLIVAEGAGGMSARLQAYGMVNRVDLEKVPLGVIHEAPNILVENDITALIKSVTAAGGVDLVVIDTLAQVTPGANENAGEDMGRALRHAKLIREATGAMVLLVHHSGKDVAKGARGWSGIKAAMDVELEVSMDEEHCDRQVRTSKQKDGRDDLSWAFDLVEVVTGSDEDGDEETSLVVGEPVEEVFEPREHRTIEQVVTGLLRDQAFGGGVAVMALDALAETLEALLPEEMDVLETLERLERDGTVVLADGACAIG